MTALRDSVFSLTHNARKCTHLKRLAAAVPSLYGSKFYGCQTIDADDNDNDNDSDDADDAGDVHANGDDDADDAGDVHANGDDDATTTDDAIATDDNSTLKEEYIPS
jgi:hypothetical protein